MAVMHTVIEKKRFRAIIKLSMGGTSTSAKDFYFIGVAKENGDQG